MVGLAGLTPYFFGLEWSSWMLANGIIILRVKDVKATIPNEGGSDGLCARGVKGWSSHRLEC